MLAVMNSINQLGDALSANARENLSNGQTLENNANTMSSSMTTVSEKQTNKRHP